MIEPHKYLLNQPEEETLLYKIVTSTNFFKMLENNCLHFTRVDTYTDDTNDSAQPPGDIEMHKKMVFENHPDFTLSDYYNRCRKRTYACCFSLRNTEYIWEKYSYRDKNSICIVFNFGKLREQVNLFYEMSQSLYQEKKIQNFFDINYGKVVYSDFQQYSMKGVPCPKSIEYAYLKNKDYHKDEEIRITLSASGVYEEFVLPDLTTFNFPKSISLGVGLKDFLNSRAVIKILINEKASKDFSNELNDKLKKHGISIKME